MAVGLVEEAASRIDKEPAAPAPVVGLPASAFSYISACPVTRPRPSTSSPNLCSLECGIDSSADALACGAGRGRLAMSLPMTHLLIGSRSSLLGLILSPLSHTAKSGCSGSAVRSIHASLPSRILPDMGLRSDMMLAVHESGLPFPKRGILDFLNAGVSAHSETASLACASVMRSRGIVTGSSDPTSPLARLLIALYSMDAE